MVQMSEGARGVEILGGTLTFQSNGLFIGQTNSSGVGACRKVHCLWPVVVVAVSVEECTRACCDKES